MKRDSSTPRVTVVTPDFLSAAAVLAASVEEDGAQFRLELLDRHGQRRLCHVQPLGRAAKAPGLRQYDEIADALEIHGLEGVCE